MKVSIVTVCFNSEQTIRDTLESVVSQSYEDIEYIIVDGASTDGTLAIVDEFKDRIARVVSEPDGGIYDAMNKGISLATGDLVGLLNSDDFFASENAVSEIVECFRGNDELDIVFGDLVYVNSKTDSTVRRFYSSRRFRPWKLRFGFMPPHPATYVRKRVYDNFGLYSLDYRIASDYEMFVRWLFVNRIRFRRVNKVLVRMRMGGISTSGISNSLLLNKEIVRACVSNGLYTNVFFLMPKIPFKLLELFSRPRSTVST